MKITWENVDVDVKNKNKNYDAKYLRLVDDVTGEITGGQIMAVMGPSGGGKTTFINALAGRIPTGSITSGLINIDDRYRAYDKWLPVVGYVDQDDQIFEKLTVEETLRYSAQFRLKNASSEQINSRIEELYNRFNIKNVSKNKMLKLSGGERKRTMIAIELITDPDIIFLDEPTSGLDTRTAFNIINCLYDLAKKHNKIVILSIHQPSVEIFDLFDKVMLISNGKLVYQGDAKTCEEELMEHGIEKREKTTFPDFLVEFVSKPIDGDDKYHDVIEKLVIKNKVESQLPVSLKKKKYNDIYINPRVRLDHISTILCRKFKIELGDTAKHLKSFIWRYAIVGVAVFLAYFAIDKAIQDDMSDVLRDHPNWNEEQQSEYVKAVTWIYASFSSAAMRVLFIFFQIYYTIHVFAGEYDLIKREIAVGAFSPISYYIAVWIYSLILELIVPLTYYLILLVCKPKLCNMLTGIVFCVTPLITVPVGLFVGSLTKKPKLLTFFSYIFGAIAALKPSLWINFQESFKKEKEMISKLLRLGTLLSVIMPTVHYSAALNNFDNPKIAEFIKNSKFVASDKNEVAENLKKLADENRMYFFAIKFESVTPIYTLLAISLCLVIGLGVVLLGFLLRPKMRMRLMK